MENENLKILSSAMIEFGDKFLVKRHEDGQITLVGGLLEENESAEDAIIREVKKETNYEIKPDQLRPSGVTKMMVEGSTLLTNIFLVTVYKNSVDQFQSNNEGQELLWMTKAEMQEQEDNLSLELKLIFEEIIDQQEFIANIDVGDDGVQCEVRYLV